MSDPGPLALVGGGEWRAGCDFDASLLAASGGSTVVVLPTAAAYEGASAAVSASKDWFGGLGASVSPVMALGRPDAFDPAQVAVVREARFVYLGGGSALHLRSVLKESPMWEALLSAWREGAVVAASAAAAMVLGDPMVDPRGGAFTLGLGLVENLAVLPEAATWSHDRVRRTIRLAPAGVVLAAIDAQTALIRSSAGGWSVSGRGTVRLYQGGAEVGTEVLPG